MEPTKQPSLEEALAEIELLRARLIEVEAALAAATGTLELRSLRLHDEPAQFTHDVPPTTPR